MSASDSIAVSSAIVAACALGVSIWQGYIARHHSHLSVKPHLNIFISLALESQVIIEIKNGGIGPAFVDELRISTLSKTIVVRSISDWKRVVFEIWNSLPVCEVQSLALDPQGALPSNSTLRILTLKTEESSESLRAAFREAMKKSTIRVKYRSIYGEEFEAQITGEECAA